MPHRVRLGRTELQVSPICYGTWQLSPAFWGHGPEEKFIAAIKHAFDVGINFYDTADAYGNGLAEEVLGKALATMPRDKVIVATKCYWHFFPDGRRFPDLSPEYIAEACDNSLRRMKQSYIDLYQCHAWDPLTSVPDVVNALEKLVKQGKIRHYGTSNWTVEQMRWGNQVGKFATAQPLYSLLKRGIEPDVLPYCQASDTGTLVYSSLAKGLLTGKYKGDEKFDDLRKNDPDFQGDRFKMIAGKLAEVGKIAEKHGLTTTQCVLAVTLMHPGITSAIVGVKEAKQIEESAGAMGKTVPREDANKVRSLLAV